MLELKTKTTCIDTLAGSAAPPPDDPVMVPEHRAGDPHRGARHGLARRAPAGGRRAARARGYPLAFHFDPIVIDDGCEAEYRRTVERLFAAIDPEHIVWISLGALRFMPDLKAIVQRRFPHSKIVYGEFIAGLDGKMRYFKPLRMKVYRAHRAGHPRACAGGLRLSLHGGRRGVAARAGLHARPSAAAWPACWTRPPCGSCGLNAGARL
ncbi:MAG: hypothetical protein MZV70_67830 [Desulfobacterales bacterium]|nr:hypothetical protein [Desulfobacterales bacterium]